MADIESRLHCIVSISSDVGPMRTMYEIASAVRSERPAEFTYQRLGDTHVVKSATIYDFVSLSFAIGAIEKVRLAELVEIGEIDPESEMANNGDDEFYWSYARRNTTDSAAFEDYLVERSVQYLRRNGFHRESFLTGLTAIYAGTEYALPNWRTVKEGMGIEISDSHFLKLTSIRGVRRSIGFTVATRRLMRPTEPQ